MEKQMEMDWVVSSKREHRYDEIRELIGQLTLIEKYIRIRLINGSLQKEEDALHILLDQHRDAVRDLGMHLISLKILDSEDEEEYVEDEDECDTRAEDDDDDCEAIDQYKDADDEDGEDADNDCVCKQIRDLDILRELYSAWLPNRGIYFCENLVFIKCGQFYFTFGSDIDILQSTNIFMPYFTFANHQDEHVHYACFDQENFIRLMRRINDTIGYNIAHYANNTIATRLKYD